MTAPVRLGAPHCCVCAGICFHIGPIQLCGQHERHEPHPPAIIIAPGPVTYVPAGASMTVPTCPTCCNHDHRTTT